MRQLDDEVYELAGNYGVHDHSLAKRLYSQACNEVLGSRETIAGAYERLLAQTTRHQVAQGKRTRTAAPHGEPTRWAAPTPGASPGKRTRTMTMAEEIAKRDRFTRAQRREAQRREEDTTRSGADSLATMFPGFDFVMSVIRNPSGHDQSDELAVHDEPFGIQETPGKPVIGPSLGPMGSVSDPAFGVLAATNNVTAAPANPPIQGKEIAETSTREAAPEPIDTGATDSGEPLPEPVRAKMETALGMDFSNVRVHVGPQAKKVGAVAFTRGTDIFFAPGHYEPWTQCGQELLGHELAHVVQQAKGRVAKTADVGGVPLNDDAALEREADREGARVARLDRNAETGSKRLAAPIAPSVVQRKPAEPSQDPTALDPAMHSELAEATSGAPVTAVVEPGKPVVLCNPLKTRKPYARRKMRL
ncbi:MAG: DUF4157 domain-containing protein [Proteobacteria bacterium]|nr:DUF4157 domain-containing protein [Pseudomonadota bacterium]